MTPALRPQYQEGPESLIILRKLAMAYKAIGFDYGGVISGLPGSFFMSAMAGVLDVPVDTLQKTFFENNHRANVEKLSWADLWKHISTTLGHPEKHEEVMLFIQEWEKNQTVNQDVMNLIDSLHTAGYTVGLLSNYADGLRLRLEQQGISNRFDVIAISSEMGAMKPQPEAFVIFCEMLQIKPNELVYIDDTKKSLETAAAVGYTPIHFRDFESLYQELVTLKVI